MVPVTSFILISALQAEATLWLPTNNKTPIAVPNNEKIIYNKWIQLTKTVKNLIPTPITSEIKHNSSNRFNQLVEVDKEYEEDKLSEKQK